MIEIVSQSGNAFAEKTGFDIDGEDRERGVRDIES